MTINSFMTNEHRKCDDVFAELESAIDSGNFQASKELFEKFHNDMLKHFRQEETVMFAEFNSCSGGGCNPTSVMLAEHDQMRVTMDQIKTALDNSDKNRALGLSENLLFIMQQHNMKEEQIMYNLADNTLNSDDIIEKMKLVS
ncbi:hemerythrin domain-containing protein [Arcobacter sp. FWKO B]|uniref:hemerythrin domain-containing protein n=1 Tax=Arcobacter sp. FWKO B TaxID=2593672 RepID=UPI0018A5C6B1|nr:hemerythrin domain-containing protein [Arcobacter sp. FWKO B]QOG11932.1 hemerythrin domain-containing protein [Arcobacter sp. FWKO B]